MVETQPQHRRRHHARTLDGVAAAGVVARLLLLVPLGALGARHDEAAAMFVTLHEVVSRLRRPVEVAVCDVVRRARVVVLTVVASCSKRISSDLALKQDFQRPIQISVRVGAEG